MAVIAGFALMLTCAVVGNLLMKLGTATPPSPLLLGLWSWKTLTGFATFGFSGLVYAWLLKFLPLNVAQSFAAAQFVSIILASAIVLSEPIPPTRWIGIALIISGIIVVGLTVNSGPGAGDGKLGTTAGVADRIVGSAFHSAKAPTRQPNTVGPHNLTPHDIDSLG
jgi:undecaprenyl phosphate-alpha-L-ara4N flippase subunit ArnE